MTEPAAVSIRLDGAKALPGLWLEALQARACLVLGAGAGMHHRAMATLADGLAVRQISTLRFNFPSMARGSKRPDAPVIAQAAVRAAVTEAQAKTDLPLLAGERSFGGCMTSGAQAEMPLPGILGLVFFAYPLHPAGKPSTGRADQFADVQVPMPPPAMETASTDAGSRPVELCLQGMTRRMAHLCRASLPRHNGGLGRHRARARWLSTRLGTTKPREHDDRRVRQ